MSVVDFNLRKITLVDHPAVLEIAQNLPQWFTATGLQQIQKDLLFQQGFVIQSPKGLVGFLTYFVNQGEAMIGWMGISPDYRRNGLGKVLMEGLKQELSIHSIHAVSVSTLGDSVDYEPYAQTRAFYRALGFKDDRKVKHEDNPEFEEEIILRLTF